MSIRFNFLMLIGDFQPTSTRDFFAGNGSQGDFVVDLSGKVGKK